MPVPIEMTPGCGEGDAREGRETRWALSLRDERRDEQRYDAHDLNQDRDARAGRILERVADGVADDRRLVGVGAFGVTGEAALLDELLGVVRGAAPVRHHQRHRGAHGQGSRERSGQHFGTEGEPEDRWGEYRDGPWGDHLLDRGGSGQVDDALRLGLHAGAALEQAGNLPEL